MTKNTMDATEKLEKRIESTGSFLSVGLDPDMDNPKFPKKFATKENPQFEFNKWVIDQTAEYALAYKPNTAFYEARGEQGWKELRLTMEYLQEHHPEIFTICDAKRADIGNTNKGYVKAIFDTLGFDAITLHPYLGREALQPFLSRIDKVSIILCKTSNSGSGELQDLEVPVPSLSGFNKIGEANTLWQVVAQHVAYEWNHNKNCMIVMGATYPEEIKKARAIVGDMTMLVPGVGAQGGSIGDVLANGLNNAKKGIIINSSRGVIFAESPKASAQKLHREIQEYLHE